MLDRLTKFIRPRWMFDTPPETRREFSLEDPWLIETLWQWTAGGFLRDGYLRDIRADIDPARLNALVAHIRQSGRTLTYEVGDTEQSFDGFDFASLWQWLLKDEGSALLSVEFDGHWVRAHFDDDSRIEFYTYPEYVTEANFASLVAFMTEMSSVLDQPVTMTDPGEALLFAIDTHRRVAIVPVPPFASNVDNLGA